MRRVEDDRYRKKGDGRLFLDRSKEVRPDTRGSSVTCEEAKMLSHGKMGACAIHAVHREGLSQPFLKQQCCLGTPAPYMAEMGATNRRFQVHGNGSEIQDLG